ncbi:hypothetical protein EKE90_21765 [Escherichia coli]|nr:hypothetical protein [Escherichia coli]
MSEKWSKEFDSCFQVGSIEEIADALEKRSGSEENALAMLAMTAFRGRLRKRKIKHAKPVAEAVAA